MKKALALECKETTITPAVAEHMLRYTEDQSERLVTGSRQRNLSGRAVTHFARQMKEGKWKMNGQPIIVDPIGRVLDGQHRLSACVESGASFRTLIVENVSRDVFETLDTGNTRGGNHALQIHGVNHYTQEIAGAIVWALKFKNGNLVASFGNSRTPKKRTKKNGLSDRNGLHQRVGKWKGVQYTNDEIVEFYKKNPQIEQSVLYMAALKTRSLIPVSLAGALHFCMAELGGEKAADIFWECTIKGLGEPGPEINLHEKLWASKEAKGRGGGLPIVTKAALAIKAWNFRRDDNVNTRLVFTGFTKRGNAERFPTLR